MFKLTVVGCVINYNREQILLSGHFNLNVNPSHSIEHLLASQRISLNMSWMLRCSQWHLSVKKIAHHTISQHALDQFNYRSLYHLFIPVFFFFLLLLLLFLLIADCGANEFQCKSDQLCIPLNRVADGKRDCSDGSDECENATQFRCKCGIPVCIEKAFFMDGQIHCEDGSDEGLNSAGVGCMSNELSSSK